MVLSFKTGEFYGSFQELGTKYIDGTAFMRKALAQNEWTARNEFRDELKQMIRDHHVKTNG